MNTSIHKHSAGQNQEGVYALHRDGNLCPCPKMMYPQIQQGQTPLREPQFQTLLSQIPCTTKCPFAQVLMMTPAQLGWSSEDTTTMINVYEISCEGGVRKIILDEIVPFKKEEAPPPGKVLSISK